MLVEALSPTSAVRRSCAMLMADPPISSNIDNDTDDDFDQPPPTVPSRGSGGRRTVGIVRAALSDLADSISFSMLRSPSGQFAEWDEGGWHYTAEGYRMNPRTSGCTVDEMRAERVALYVLALDAVNFCFWPTASTGGEGENLLEYEHMAIALKGVAEMDDGEDGVNVSVKTDQLEDCTEGKLHVCAEDTYALSPRNLASLTLSDFLRMVSPHLPRGGGRYDIPNADERVRLLNELGFGLRERHGGSALRMIESADRSADKLVDVLTSNFRGFRDESVDALGRQVCFYKRAQIAVGDLWAALGPGNNGRRRKGMPRSDVCDFTDLDRLTMFADYRIPQLLRHLGVMRYASSLAGAVDGSREMAAGCADELYMRAGTVVSVDMLVKEVKDRLTVEGRVKETEGDDDGCGDSSVFVERDELIKSVCAVKLDWHLWQLGEKLDREGKLGPHHRVRTIFY